MHIVHILSNKKPAIIISRDRRRVQKAVQYRRAESPYEFIWFWAGPRAGLELTLISNEILEISLRQILHFEISVRLHVPKNTHVKVKQV